MDNTAPSETTAPDRRRFLRTLGAGGVASALAVAISASKANAQTVPPGSSAAGTTAGAGAATTAPATTTTLAAPKSPTTKDVPLLGFALQYELAISAAYDAAIARLDGSSLSLDASLIPVVRVFRQHHVAYAQALSGLIGKTAPTGPNAAILKSIVDPFQSGAAADFLKAAATVENTAVATHLTLMQQLASTDAATLIASIIPIEARHAVVFELAAKSTDLIPSSGSESLSLALDPSKYPAE